MHALHDRHESRATRNVTVGAKGRVEHCEVLIQRSPDVHLAALEFLHLHILKESLKGVGVSKPQDVLHLGDEGVKSGGRGAIARADAPHQLVAVENEVSSWVGRVHARPPGDHITANRAPRLSEAPQV